MVARHPLDKIFTNISGFSHLGKTNANKLLTKKQHIKACLIN
jgi:hypothetical protein